MYIRYNIIINNKHNSNSFSHVWGEGKLRLRIVTKDTSRSSRGEEAGF